MEDDVFIHSPDQMDDDNKNGLICWMNMNRPCGADCMAYLSSPPEGKDYIGQWAHCQFLVDSHRLSKHVAILAQSAVKKDREVIKSKQDERRHALNPAHLIPKPLGGKA